MRQLLFADTCWKGIILRNRIKTQPSFCVGICLAVLILPIRWVSAWILAAACHEFGHLLVLKICKIPVTRITLDVFGAKIETGSMLPAEELICSLAGPAFGILSVLFSSVAPYFSICGFLQSVYNLLPFSGFDGGRALQIVQYTMIPPLKADLATKCIQFGVFAILILLGGHLWIARDLGFVSFLLMALPVLKSQTEKILANRQNK